MNPRLPRRALVTLSALAALALAASGCGRPAPLVPRSATAPEIRTLPVGTGTNAYLLMGERPILVDTGWGRSTKKIERGLARHGVAPGSLALIILTHGHGDHAGGANRLRALSGAPVAAGRGDLEMLAAGHNRPLRPMGAFARLIRPLSDKPFPPFAPDIIIDAPFELGPYGVAGRILPVPGHTPGSLAVVLATGDAIVGDMLRGGTVFSRSPTRHYFHDDCRAAEAHIAPLADAGTRRFWVGHGGPLDASKSRKLHGEGCK